MLGLNKIFMKRTYKTLIDNKTNTSCSEAKHVK